MAGCIGELKLQGKGGWDVPPDSFETGQVGRSFREVLKVSRVGETCHQTVSKLYRMSALAHKNSFGTCVTWYEELLAGFWGFKGGWDVHQQFAPRHLRIQSG